jgi:hypothetical protein
MSEEILIQNENHERGRLARETVIKLEVCLKTNEFSLLSHPAEFDRVESIKRKYPHDLLGDAFLWKPMDSLFHIARV